MHPDTQSSGSNYILNIPWNSTNSKVFLNCVKLKACPMSGGRLFQRERAANEEQCLQTLHQYFEWRGNITVPSCYKSSEQGAFYLKNTILKKP